MQQPATGCCFFDEYMSDTTGKRSCYTLSPARDEVVRTDRDGRSIFRGYCPPPLCRHGCFLGNIMRSNSSAYGLPTFAKHSRWPEPPRPEEQYPGRRCSRDYLCKRRMYLGCPRPGYMQNSQSRPKGDGLPNKCGKSPDTACPCRERYGMRQSGLRDGFREYDRQQPPRGLLPVMNPDPM